MADFEALARAHQAAQVTQAGQIQVALARLWDQTIDPSDLDRTFDLFRRRALTLINAGRVRGEATAQQYYEAIRLLAGEDGPGVALAQEPYGDAYTLANLSRATDITYAKMLIARGGDVAALMATAREKMLGSAKRQVLQAGRNRLTRAAAADPDLRGWARISDGDPCAFCAMLVSRGPVYSAETVNFRAHDRCGCSVRLISRSRADPEWTADAEKYRAMWERTPSLSALRSSIADDRALAAEAKAD